MDPSPPDSKAARNGPAGPLEGVTGPINEAIGTPVREVTETVTTPVTCTP